MWSLKKLRSNYRELTSIIYKQEERIQFLETKALHLSMFYVASQLLIFVTNSKPSPYQCRNWWKPFFLSLSIAVIFALNFATTLIKYVRMKYEQDRNFIDQGENYHHMAFLERHGSSINRSDDHLQIISNNININPVVLEIDHIAPDHRDHQEQHKPDMFVVYQRYTHIWITVFVLLGFTALVLHACRSSVCGDAVQ